MAEVINPNTCTVHNIMLEDILSVEVSYDESQQDESDDQPIVPKVIYRDQQHSITPKAIYYGCFTRDPKEIAKSIIRPKTPRPNIIRSSNSWLEHYVHRNSTE